MEFMQARTMPPIEPGNPFVGDMFNMGTIIGANVTVMYGNHAAERQAYIIVVNTETGERMKITFPKRKV